MPATERDGAAVVSIAGLDIAYQSRHGRVAAVKDVSFKVERGALRGRGGKPGRRKSTVLRAIMGLLHPKERIIAGAIPVAGIDGAGARRPAVEKLRRRHMAMVFQDPLRALNPV